MTTRIRVASAAPPPPLTSQRRSRWRLTSSPLLIAALALAFLLLVCCALPAFAQGGDQTIGGGEAPVTPTQPTQPTQPGNGNGNGNAGGGGGGGGNNETPGGGDGPIDSSNPDSAGGPTASSGSFPVWAIIVCAIAGSLLILFFIMKFHSPRATHFDVVIFFLALLDFGSDVWFIYTLRDNESFPTIFKLAIAFTCIPFFMNFFVLMYIIWREMANLAFRRWLHFHFAPFTAVFLTACTSVDAMFVLDSHVGGLKCLSAPWSESMTTRLRLAGFITICFEDIPQVCLQIFMIASSRYQLVNLVALCSSLTTVVFGLTKRMLVCLSVAYEAQAKDLELGSTSSTDDSIAVTKTAAPTPSSAATGGSAVAPHHPHMNALALGAAVGAGVKKADDLHLENKGGELYGQKEGEVQREGVPNQWEKDTSIQPGAYGGGEQHHTLDVPTGDAQKEWSTSHVKYHAPLTAQSTPESRYRSLGAGAGPFAVAGSSAAAHRGENPVVAASVPSATNTYSPGSASVDRLGSNSSPAPTMPARRKSLDSDTPLMVARKLEVPTPKATAGSALVLDASSPRPPLPASPRPSLPPRPSSAHNSPLMQLRSLAGTPMQASSHQQENKFFSPQMAPRTLQSSVAASAASPPMPARPLSTTHAAHTVPNAALAEATPAFTVDSTAGSRDTEFHTHAGDVQPFALNHAPDEPKTLAEIMKGH